MGITKYLEKLENFFCASGVSTSNYGVVRHYLLGDPIQRELYPRLLQSAYGLEESTGSDSTHCVNVKARPSSNTPKRWQSCVAGPVCQKVARFVGEITLRDVYHAIWLQEPLTFVDAQKLASGWFRGGPAYRRLVLRVGQPCQENGTTGASATPSKRAGCFNYGSLDHLSRRCPNKRQRGHRQPTGAQNVRSGDCQVLAISGLRAGNAPIRGWAASIILAQNNREPGQKVIADAKIVALILKLRLLHQPRQTVRYKHLLDLESPLTFIHTSHCLSIRGCSARIAGADSLSISSL
ncbi:hypothetical protein T02_14105 [Trichinella nativa]|uniref:Uncharacterized protein n=1 Tax=Trichinella nativa TaxID=6335 RepID=A0A0V1LLQ8_9BILA|nr:hypothetical protein T02_14105 [Trichinella nativa]